MKILKKNLSFNKKSFLKVYNTFFSLSETYLNACKISIFGFKGIQYSIEKLNAKSTSLDLKISELLLITIWPNLIDDNVESKVFSG